MKAFKDFLFLYLMRTMATDLIIETNELTKSYGPHVALDKLSIQVQRGATGLLGPNGAGKSTFFKTTQKQGVQWSLTELKAMNLFELLLTPLDRFL